MTLITNEIHFDAQLSKPIIISTADRKITSGGSSKYWKKLFLFEKAKSTVSYFGLAAWPDVRNNRIQIKMPDIIESLHSRSTSTDPQALAREIYSELQTRQSTMPLNQYVSGLHVCGFNQAGLPEFWFISNCQSVLGHSYSGFLANYQQPAEHFLARDAINAGYSGGNAAKVKAGSCYYMNGAFEDYRTILGKFNSCFARPDKIEQLSMKQIVDKVRRRLRRQYSALCEIHSQKYSKCTIGGEVDIFILPEQNSHQARSQSALPITYSHYAPQITFSNLVTGGFAERDTSQIILDATAHLGTERRTAKRLPLHLPGV